MAGHQEAKLRPPVLGTIYIVGRRRSLGIKTPNVKAKGFYYLKKMPCRSTMDCLFLTLSVRDTYLNRKNRVEVNLRTWQPETLSEA